MNKPLRHPASIRIFHWVQMISITMLGISGYFITDPFGKNIFKTMDGARYVHFVFMWILTAAFSFRVYLYFGSRAGRDVLPFRDMKGIGRLMKYMLFLSKEHPHYKKYNPMQKLLYTFWEVLVLVQIITGIVLYVPAISQSWALAMGGFMVVRLIHNAVFWFFACTVLLHIYLDLTIGIDEAWSMITGYGSSPTGEILPVPNLDTLEGLELGQGKKPVTSKEI